MLATERSKPRVDLSSCLGVFLGRLAGVRFDRGQELAPMLVDELSQRGLGS